MTIEFPDAIVQADGHMRPITDDARAYLIHEVGVPASVIADRPRFLILNDVNEFVDRMRMAGLRVRSHYRTPPDPTVPPAA